MPQGVERDAGLAIERLGQNARERGLADAAGAGKQIGMMQPLLFKRVGKRPDHVILSDQLGKALRAPFAGENLSLGHE